MKKGLIVLDLDGTVTAASYEIPQAVKEHLEWCVQDGWLVAISTGRCLGFANCLAQDFPHPVFVGLQNGAALIRLPDQQLLHRNYLSVSELELIAKIASKHKVGFAIEAGADRKDAYYYVHAFPIDDQEAQIFYDSSLRYFRSKHEDSLVRYLDQVTDFPFEDCAMATFCLTGEKATPLLQELDDTDRFTVSLIKDSWRPGYYLLHVNHKNAGKGSIVDALKNHEIAAEHSHFVIVGGDDANDIPMLKKGDFKIVMGTAPAEMLSLADCVAPPASEMGIIVGIQKGIEAYNKTIHNYDYD